MADKTHVKKRPRHKPLILCRVCLTYSPSLRGLTEEFDRNCGIATILDLLKKVMCCEIELTRGTPDHICSVCLSFLKISYDFKLQFEDSQKKIIGNQHFGSEDNNENYQKTSGEVELIVGDKNFSLDDVVIVEEEDVKEDYTHLLNNLGKAISVECVKTNKPSDHGQAFYDKVVDEKSVNKEDYTHLIENLVKAISVEGVKIEATSDDGQAFDDEVVDDEDWRKEDFTHLLKNFGKTISGESGKTDTANDHTNEHVFNEKVIALNHDEKIFEPYFEELENSEDYETIIIKYDSETEESSDESSEDQSECVESAEIKKKGKELLDRINSLIIEDERDRPYKISPKKIRINDPLPKAIMNKSQRKKVELAEIAKYIIYKKDDDEQISGTNGFSNNAKNELDSVSSPKISETNDSLSRIKENIHQNSISAVNGLEAYKFSCPTCSLKFKFKKTLDRHLDFAHGIGIISKEASNKSKGKGKGRAQNKSKITTTLTLEERMAIREQNRKFRKKMWNLQKNRRPLLCQICGYVSKSSGGAFYHAKTHGERHFKCQICPREFYTATHLKNHVKYKHEKFKSPHLCNICGESKNSFTALRYHLKLHTNEPKPFSCHICNIGFLVKGALTTHLRRHLGDRRFVCSICNKSFFTNDERKKHTMTHTGERPFKCRYCEKKFLTRYNQKVHMMSHRGPYFCKLCSRGLADKDLLNDHMNFKHFSQQKPKPVRPSQYPGPSYQEDGEIVEIYELPKGSPASSSDNGILEVLNLLEGSEDNELRLNEVNSD